MRAGLQRSVGLYGDNGGTFTTTYAIATSGSATPEPSSYTMMLGGGAMLLGFLRRKLA